MCLSLLPASRRTYALSRFPTRPVTGARWRLRPPPNPPRENQPSADESLLWHTSGRPPTSRQAEGLRTLLLRNNTLIIERCDVPRLPRLSSTDSLPDKSRC